MSRHYRPSLRQIQDWQTNYLIDKARYPNVIVTNFELSGQVEFKDIAAAFGSMVKRHKILRASFPIIDSRITLAAIDYESGSFQPLHFTCLDRNALEKKISQLSFSIKDIGKGPLIRCLVVGDGQSAFRIFIIIHHIIADHHSAELIKKCFTTMCLGGTNITDRIEDSPGYPDYIEDNYEKISAAHDKSISYWQSRLRGKGWQIEHDEIGRSFSRNPNISGPVNIKNRTGLLKRDLLSLSAGESISTEMPSEMAKQLESYSRCSGYSHFIVLLATVAVLACTICQNDYIVLQVIYADRSTPKLSAMIGNLLGTLIVFLKLDREASFVNHIRHAYASLFKAAGNLIYNSAQLEEYGLSARSFIFLNFVGNNSLSETEYSIDNIGHVEKLEIETPLYLAISEYKNKTIFKWEYNLLYFNQDMIRNMNEALFNCLQKGLQNLLNHLVC